MTTGSKIVTISKKLLPWLCVILWMVFIFILSHQPATESNNLSTGVTEILIKAVNRVFPNYVFDMEFINHIVRKYAHFFAYLMLGILVSLGFTVNGVTGYRGFGFTMLICILYAASDEIHQLYVSGRSCQVTDIVIDSAGAFMGGVINRRIYRIMRVFRSRADL